MTPVTLPRLAAGRGLDSGEPWGRMWREDPRYDRDTGSWEAADHTGSPTAVHFFFWRRRRI